MALQILVSLGFILPQRKISLEKKKSASVLELNIWTKARKKPWTQKK